MYRVFRSLERAAKRIEYYTGNIYFRFFFSFKIQGLAYPIAALRRAAAANDDDDVYDASFAV